MADWEPLIDLLYGLILLKLGKMLTLDEIHKVSLKGKVDKICQEGRLATLAKPDWVTVRNSLAHGKAFFDPTEKSIQFRDRNKIISWSIEQTYLEAIDILLANLATLKIWNFVQVAQIHAVEEFFENLKSLAEQR